MAPKPIPLSSDIEIQPTSSLQEKAPCPRGPSLVWNIRRPIIGDHGRPGPLAVYTARRTGNSGPAVIPAVENANTQLLSVVYDHGADWEVATRLKTSGAKPMDRGAALVELAFALPLVLMLILGMVSGGIAFNHQLALTHSVREGGRHAATLPVSNFGSMDAWLDAVALGVVDDATGSLGPGVAGHYVCVAYVHPDGVVSTDQTRRRIDDGGVLSYDGSPCFVDGRPDAERRVQIAVARDTDFNALVFSTTLTLDSQAVSRFEAAGGF